MDDRNPFLKMFQDPEAIARYAEGPARFVPGFDALHRMTDILLSESAPSDASVLVLGAGGGLELKALASTQPGWRFVGVDPARPMLDLALQTLGPLSAQVELVEGYVDDAPIGPFDAAACLLTLHFLDRAERLRTLKEIRRRLRPGAPFVAAHSSFPQHPAVRGLWLSRYAAHAVAAGADPALAEQARQGVATTIQLFDPEEDEALLKEAGFAEVSLFWAAFTWRGWIGRA